MFRVGQKVVCVSNGPDGYVAGQPDIGDIATVSNVYVDGLGCLDLELVEFPSPESEEFYAGFGAEYFRPVVDREADISIFTKMLTPKREKLAA